MPWYFYNSEGQVTPRPVAEVATGSVLLTYIPHTSTAPDGYVFCDGTAYPKSGIYLDLYAVIGGSHGETPTHFNVPDYRGAFFRGVTSSSNVAAGAGTVDHSHSVNTSHAHNINGSHSHEADVALQNHSHGQAHTHNLQTVHYHEVGTYELGPPNAPSHRTRYSAGTDRTANSTHTHAGAGGPGSSGTLNGNTAAVNATSGSPNPASVGTSGTALPTSLSATLSSASATVSTGDPTSVASTVTNNMPPFIALGFMIKL